MGRGYAKDMSHGRGNVWRFGVPLALGVIAAGIAATSNRAPSAAPATIGSRGPSVPWQESLARPLEGGRKTTLANARAELPFGLLVPSHPAAGEGSLESVWVAIPQGRPEGAEAALVFSSGIFLRQEISRFKDQAAFWQRLVNEGFPGEVRTIDGHPAYVAEAGIDDTKDNPAVVAMVVGDDPSKVGDGTVVTIYSEGGPASLLVDIAASMA